MNARAPAIVFADVSKRREPSSATMLCVAHVANQKHVTGMDYGETCAFATPSTAAVGVPLEEVFGNGFE